MKRVTKTLHTIYDDLDNVAAVVEQTETSDGTPLFDIDLREHAQPTAEYVKDLCHALLDMLPAKHHVMLGRFGERKIAMIKVMREHIRGLGLKDAKTQVEAVDQHARHHGEYTSVFSGTFQQCHAFCRALQHEGADAKVEKR